MRCDRLSFRVLRFAFLRIKGLTSIVSLVFVISTSDLLSLRLYTHNKESYQSIAFLFKLLKMISANSKNNRLIRLTDEQNKTNCMETLKISEKKDKIKWDYDAEADVLYISFGNPQNAEGVDG